VRSHSCTADRTSSSSCLHNRDAVLELLSPFIHLRTTHTPVTILNSHPTMNLYRFYAFAKQKSHNTSLLLLSALLQGHRHLVKLFPRFVCVPTPSIGSSRSPPSHTLHTMISVVHVIFNTTFPVFHRTVLVYIWSYNLIRPLISHLSLLIFWKHM